MAKFVCVRIIQGWGLDLDRFQFDPELTWSAMFFHPDGTIYGRYGSRGDHKDTLKYLSMEGFKKALKGALDLHGRHDAVKASLAGKKGPAAPWKYPQDIPDLAGKPFNKPADGTRGGCIHCHQAGDSTAWSLRARKEAVPDRLIWPYPVPERVGLTLDPKAEASVSAVEPGSPAAKAGFQAGDRIRTFSGQPMLSIADLQWVLHRADDGATIEAEVERGGAAKKLSLALPAGWRKKDDFTWRVIAWSMRHRLLGTQPLEAVPGANGMALKVKGFPPNWVKEKNPDGAKLLKAGDVITGVEGAKGLVTESDLLGHLFQKPPGVSVTLLVQRDGVVQKVPFKLP